MNMENSGQSEKVIGLGKLLVKELGLEPGVDTLARWMTHYLAEKIHKVEILPEGTEKTEAEKECCDLILKIWDHRSVMPRGRRPFETFEPILKVLESIDPDNRDPYFHRMSEHELKQLATSNADFEEIKPYIEGVIEIDKVARLWMEHLLNQAALKVTDEKTQAWLDAATQVSMPADVHAIKIAFKNFNLLNHDDDESLKDTSRLEKRIQQLERFRDFNEQLTKLYQNELVYMKKPKSKSD